MSTVTPPPPPSQAAPIPGPAPKKKTSPLVWILVGCGGIVLIGLLVLALGTYFVGKKISNFAKDAERNPAVAAAKVMALVNPDIEIVSSDDEAGTVTLRNTKTGEEITMNAEDIKQGRLKFKNEKGEEVTFEAQGEGGKDGLSVKSDKGEMHFGSGDAASIPAWLPSYPGSTPDGTYSARTPDGDTGGYSFETNDGADEVASFFRRELEDAGFSIDSSGKQSAGSTTIANLTASSGGKKVTIAVTHEGGSTRVVIGYESK
ncbi:MAG: hypothetical protein HY825_05015 [Acidobacteria bacterium]|nr:hypothetical protein [Acidobacteriota bacterium]